jgi:hypothetical protein
MQATANPLAPPARRRRRWKTWLALALVLIGVPPAYMAYRRWADRRELEEVLAELDRHDPGWRLEDLWKRHRRVPDGQSAAKQVLKVMVAANADIDLAPLPTQLFKATQVIAKNLQLGDAQAAALHELLAAEPALRAEAFKLKDLPDGSFDAAQDPDGMRLQDARKVRCWLWLDATLRAHEGDGDGALAAFRGMLHAVRSLEVEPGGHGLVWCKQFHPTAMQVLEWSLAHTEPDEEALRLTQAALERETRLELREALRERRARGWHRLEPALAGEPLEYQMNAKRVFSRAWLSTRLPIVTAGDAAAYLRGMNRLIDATEPPLDGRFDELMQLIQEWEAADPLFIDGVEAAHQAIWEHYWSQTHLRLALTATAAERYRRKTGAWPVVLDELVKAGLLREVPLDPFDGAPLRWDRNLDGVSVRSARYGTFRLWDPDARRRSAE